MLNNIERTLTNFSIIYNRKYVTKVQRNYKPYYYPWVRSLNKVLKGKIIINQSDKILSDTQTEILSLGLNFIFATNDKKERSKLNNDMEEWMRKIDVAIHFNGRQTNHTKGWLQKDLKTNWQPPPMAWRFDRELEKLSKEIIQESKEEPDNTPQVIIEELYNLANDKEIHILPADKGRNTVIWNAKDYDIEAQRQLQDRTTYEELTKDEYEKQLEAVAEKCDGLTERLFKNKNISSNERQENRKIKPMGSRIYFLPKPHKGLNKTTGTFYGRPVVATHSAKTHILDKYITALTAPLLQRIPGSLRDTGDVLEKLPKKGTALTRIATADVIGLYPNIPWREGVLVAKNFYTTSRRWLIDYARTNNLKAPPDTEVFGEILELILFNSYINFKNKRFFKQTQGTAMGMCISVYFANAYMYDITKEYVHRPPKGISMFLRYIDDLLIITEGISKENLDNFFTKISNQHIKYTVEKPAREQPFLDLMIEIDQETNNFETKTYWKDTASGSFLHPKSNHPKHTIKSIPHSQFLRLSRNASTIERYYEGAVRLRKEFKRLTYPTKWVTKAMNEAAKNVEKRNRKQVSNSIKLIDTYNEAANYQINHKKLEEFTKKLNEFQDNLTQPISVQNVKRVRRQMGSYFTKNIKNPDNI